MSFLFFETIYYNIEIKWSKGTTMKKELNINLLSQMLPNKESIKKKNKL